MPSAADFVSQVILYFLRSCLFVSASVSYPYGRMYLTYRLNAQAVSDPLIGKHAQRTSASNNSVSYNILYRSVTIWYSLRKGLRIVLNGVFTNNARLWLLVEIPRPKMWLPSVGGSIYVLVCPISPSPAPSISCLFRNNSPLLLFSLSCCMNTTSHHPKQCRLN